MAAAAAAASRESERKSDREYEWVVSKGKRIDR
jgi:hypothetical protein